MFSAASAGNLIWKALVVARTLAIRLLCASDCGMLIVSVSFVYQFVRCRNLAKARQD